MTGSLAVLENVLWGVITFSILVVMHEGGHFLAARAFGVRVHEFMIGLPGPALRFRAKDMDWGITAVPLGGYVRIAGMEPGPEDPMIPQALAAIRDGHILSARDLSSALGIDEDRALALIATLEDWKAISRGPDGALSLSVAGARDDMDAVELADLARRATYRGQPTWRRIAILASGVATNLLVAIVTFTVFLSVWGYYEVTTRIDEVAHGTPAEQVGILPGDVIVGVDGKRIESWDQFQALMAATEPGQTVCLELERDGRPMTVEVTLAARDGHGYLGVGPTPVKVEPTVLESLGKSFEMTAMTFKAVIGLFDPARFSSTVQQFTSVVGVSVQAAQAARSGPIDYAYLIAALSLSLGIINLLPIPPLDGGKIVLEIVERIVGRPLSRAVAVGLSAAGTLLIFALIGYLTYLDITRLGG